jgi:choline dehydrogenase-like flavoprotein
MMNSKSRLFPTGIANSSGVLGHYLMDHNYNAVVTGDIEGYDNEYYSGRRPASLYIPNFHYEPSRYHPNFKRGYALAGNAIRSDWQTMGTSDGFGVEFKNKLRNPGGWTMRLQGNGEMLPNRENQVALSATQKDKWGIPKLHFNCKWSDNETAMVDGALETAETMMSKAGFYNIRKTILGQPPGLAIHEVGTARMGKDPKDSVLNAYNQCHDVPNLFVTDGSSFCSSGVVNPSLTFMALTVRAVDYAVKEVQARRL